MGVKILVVEDEEKLARFIELELKHEGYEVEKGLCALFIKGFVPALIQDCEVVFFKAFLQPGEFSL